MNFSKTSASPILIASALLIILLAPSIASYQNAAAITSKHAAASTTPAQSTTSFQDISFDVSGASLYNVSNPSNSPYYYYAVQQGSTITIAASAAGVNDPSYGGATSTLSITFSFVNPDGSDLVFSQSGNGEATSVSGSYQITQPNFPFVAATIDFTTYCGSLRGCPSYWQSNIVNLIFNVQPQVTLQTNTTGISAPGTIQLYGTIFPSTEAVNLTILKDGAYFDSVSPNPDVTTGSYNWNYTIYSPADYGLYRAIATVFNSDPINQEPGNSTIASLFTATAEVDFSVDSGTGNSTTSDVINSTTSDLYNPTTTTYVPPDTTTTDDTTNYYATYTTQTVAQSTTSGVPAPFSASILDPTGRPLRGVQAQLFWSTDSSTDPLLFLPISDIYYSDSQGQILINDPRINSTMQGLGYLQVTLATDTFAIKDNSSFVSDGASSVFNLKNATFDLPADNFFTVNSVADLQKTFKMVSAQSPSQWSTDDPLLGDYTHMGQLAAAYVDVMNSILFWSNNVNLHFEGYEIPIITYAPQGRTYFQPDVRPFIAIGTTDVQTLTDLPNFEYHEFSHYVMWKYFGGLNYFDSKAISGDVNHQGFNNPNSMDAWVEGWAEFWGMATWNYAHGITDPTRYDANYTVVPGYVDNMNNVVPVNRLAAGGKAYNTNAEEDALSTLLWSLYSGTDDLDGRTIMLSAQSMWAVLTSQYSLCASLHSDPLTCQRANRQIQTITDLYTALTLNSNIQAYGYTKAEIDKIFLARNILQINADGTKSIGIDNCCPYPTNNPNARNVRSDEPVDNGSGMVINSDPASLPYTLMIQVNYQAPYQQDDYSVPVQITQPQQTVYLWLPPSALYNTTAQLTATNPRGEQMAVGSITGVQYDNNTETGKPLLQTAPIQLSAGSSSTPAGSATVGLVILGAIIVLPVLGVALFVKRRMNRKKS